MKALHGKLTVVRSVRLYLSYAETFWNHGPDRGKDKEHKKQKVPAHALNLMIIMVRSRGLEPPRVLAH